jgi:hypothetical protein
MTWTMRLEASGVLALVLGGICLALLAVAGALPAAPPAALSELLALLAAIKALAAAAGLLSYVAGRFVVRAEKA